MKERSDRPALGGEGTEGLLSGRAAVTHQQVVTDPGGELRQGVCIKRGHQHEVGPPPELDVQDWVRAALPQLGRRQDAGYQTLAANSGHCTEPRAVTAASASLFSHPATSDGVGGLGTAATALPFLTSHLLQRRLQGSSI